MSSNFSTFTRGNESNSFHAASRPPRQPRLKKQTSIGNLVESISRATSAAYDSFIGSTTDDEDDGDIIPVGILRRRSGIVGFVSDVGSLLSPRRDVTERLVRYWWSRAFLLVLLPAGVVVGWCAIPLPITIKPNTSTENTIVSSIVDAILHMIWPEKHFHSESNISYNQASATLDDSDPASGSPGHGKALVEIHWWFFLLVYYGFYLLMGLFYMTSLFNLYNLNWWPARLGGPATYLLSWSISVAIGIPIYYFARPLAHLNITWILLTFITMCLPAVIAFIVLHAEDRHSSLRYHQPSAYLNASSNRTQNQNTAMLDDEVIEDEHDPNESTSLLSYGNIFTRTRSSSNASSDTYPPRNTPFTRLTRTIRRRTRWIPYSYIRFLWFCAAILLGLVAFVLGELYAEIYLRTLPHSNKETVIYVYSWVGTILALDGITGYILSSQVQSYPLEFVFKLYFSLTYYTYIRTLYARLRSPSQFAILQLLSSSIAILLQPLYISHTFHRFMTYLGFTSTTYSEHVKLTGRSFYLRGLSENVSMLAFLGCIVVLHYGSNREVYPYLSFRDTNVMEDGYTFELTFFASLITWALEILSGWCVRRIFWFGWEFGVTGEGKRDLVDFEGLLVASIAVMVHALMNMLMSIIRLKFA
ncbi:hypothetical protein H072_11586 [Dactylellina haptotyla CBS 200.50]|uniref:Uncharacterized protein n=1 Tax=Dactylellina haptotyla (strain CBS 200.50) TaxID=1284197 RepID=S8BIV9_DACHA|nr:hypothetical protein H072_11586 [Dactylellina haptotyla CBS 200.50]